MKKNKKWLNGIFTFGIILILLGAVLRLLEFEYGTIISIFGLVIGLIGFIINFAVKRTKK